jgi:ubiquinone/menaquinone biosynthesis C-methylase UbiE
VSTTEPVDPSNAEQLGNWDGDTGAFWAAHANRFDEAVAAYHSQFLAAAAIDETATVLDVGCGSGQATRDAARCATAGSALGVDLSSHMIQLARRRAESEQVVNATFQQADAQVHPFSHQSFDIVISRHGAMFFGDPIAAFTNIARALRPGGCLVPAELAAVRAQRVAQRLLHSSGCRSRAAQPTIGRAEPVRPERSRPGAITADIGRLL